MATNTSSIDASQKAHYLMALLSPSFPTGGFSYSHGLEYAIAAKLITDSGSLRQWLLTLLEGGSLWNEAVLFAHSYSSASPANSKSTRLTKHLSPADPQPPEHSELEANYARALAAVPIADLALALAGSKERQQESLAQGRAFAQAASAVLDEQLEPAPLPIAVAAAGSKLGIALEALLPLYLHSQVANFISVAVRLIPIGQIDGQKTLSKLFPTIDRVARQAAVAELDSLGSCTIMSDIAAMRHEDMTTRIFRT